MLNGGFILLYRKLLDWEWWQDSNTVHVWIYLLLRANYIHAQWRGMDIMRGSLITSIGNIAKDCGLSEQNVRTALSHLKKSRCIDVKVTNKYSLITIYEYDKYQSLIECNQQANQQATNKQLTSKLTTSNKYNNNNNNKINKYIVNSSNSDELEKLNSHDFFNFSQILENIELPSTMKSLTEKEYFSLRKEYTDNQLYNVIADISNNMDYHSYKSLYHAIGRYTMYNEINIIEQIES